MKLQTSFTEEYNFTHTVTIIWITILLVHVRFWYKLLYACIILISWIPIWHNKRTFKDTYVMCLKFYTFMQMKWLSIILKLCKWRFWLRDRKWAICSCRNLWIMEIITLTFLCHWHSFSYSLFIFLWSNLLIKYPYINVPSFTCSKWKGSKSYFTKVRINISELKEKSEYIQYTVLVVAHTLPSPLPSQ